MKIENISAHGFKEAIRGVRNNFDSWDYSDSRILYDGMNNVSGYILGEKDLKLLGALAKAGGSEAKALRFIDIYMDVTAPLYFWKQFDTYRLGRADIERDVEMNSCSTMHTLMNRPLSLDDFEPFSIGRLTQSLPNPYELLTSVVDDINCYISEYNRDPKENSMLPGMVFSLLPSNYLQKRTLKLNYAVARHILKDRGHHKLCEWHVFIDSFYSLPYSNELIFCGADYTA